MLDPNLLRGHLADTAARLKQTRGFDLDVAGFERLDHSLRRHAAVQQPVKPHIDAAIAKHERVTVNHIMR